MKYGPKFRETPYLDMDKISNQFKTELDTLTTKIAQKFKITRSLLKKWRRSLFKCFTNKLEFMMKNVKYPKPILSYTHIQALKMN